MTDWLNGGFGLYLHWPFCQSKCPYCDFNSHVAENIDQTIWRDSYLSEIDRAGRETQGRILQSVFFGGGTPSLMDPDLVSEILRRVQQVWPMVNDPEITLEANPGSVDAGRFQAFRQAGVNRLSMGIQSLRDDDLRMLGRRHTVAEAIRAFDIARANFDRVSFDLIYARQNQDLEDWRRELTEALSMAIDHISLYQLTVEDGTAFADRKARGGLLGLPNEDISADMYSLTQEVCTKAGFNSYEVSNHAKPGSESRHNQIYWKGGDYVGIGPGAHGRLTLNGSRFATESTKSPTAWLQSVKSRGNGELPRLQLSAEDQALEYLMMSMRLTEGLDIKRYDSLSPAPLREGRLAKLEELALIRREGGKVVTTPAGRLLLNAVILELAAD